MLFFLNDGSKTKTFSSTLEFHTTSTILGYYDLQDIKNYELLVACLAYSTLNFFVKILSCFRTYQRGDSQKSRTPT